jgi:hypothetical protein
MSYLNSRGVSWVEKTHMTNMEPLLAGSSKSFQTLVQNSSIDTALSLVGRPDMDLPPDLGDKIQVGANQQLPVQQYAHIGTGQDGKAFVHYSGAKNQTAAPCWLKLSPNQGMVTGLNALNTPQTIKFDLKTWPQILNNMYLKIVVTNTDAADAITLAPPITWFETISIAFNNNRTSGANIVLRGFTEYLAYIQDRSDEERVILQDVVNINATTLNPIAIPALATATYYVRINGFWQTAPFPMDVVDYVNVDFQTVNNAVNSIVMAGPATMADVNLVSMDLVVDTLLIPEFQYAAIRGTYMSAGGVSVKYSEVSIEARQQALDPSTSYDLAMSSLQGLGPQLTIFVRPVTPSGATFLTMHDHIQTIRVQDQSSLDILGAQPIDVDILKTHSIIENGILSQGQLVTSRSFIPLMFGMGGDTAWHKNHMKLAGYIFFLRNHMLFTTRSTTPSSSFMIYFMIRRMVLIKFMPQATGKCEVVVWKP